MVYLDFLLFFKILFSTVLIYKNETGKLNQISELRSTKYIFLVQVRLTICSVLHTNLC